MIPTAWVSIVLALAAYRLTRLVGWDTFPLAVKIRDFVSGTEVVTSGSTNARMGLTDEPVRSDVAYRRPTVAHFLACPFCVGFWISVLVYIAWIEEPTWALYALFPFALSGAVGLIARNLDYD